MLIVYQNGRSKAQYENLYLRQGLSVRRVAKELGLRTETVLAEMKRFGLVLDVPHSKETYERLYVTEQKSVREVARLLGVCTDVVVHDMRRLGVEARAVKVQSEQLAERETHGFVAEPPPPAPDIGSLPLRAQGARYDIDTEFFDRIDCDLKAYALGLLWTDGSVCLADGTVRVALVEQDAVVLESIRAAMNGAPLRTRPPSSQGGKSPVTTLKLCSKRLAGRLCQLGFCSNKTDVHPPVVRPPVQFERAFVRGLVDGDGSLNRPDYPTIVFSNQNPHLRAIVIEHWEGITGRRPPTYTARPRGTGRTYMNVVEIGERAQAIMKALYLDDDGIAIPRKRERARAYQAWRKQSKQPSLPPTMEQTTA